MKLLTDPTPLLATKLIHAVTLLTALTAIWSQVGCSSTGQQNIEAQKALFESYPPAEQQLIESGQVAVGFDQDKVRMAYGDPDKVRTATNQNGTRLIWEYTQIKPPRPYLHAGVSLRRGFDTGIGITASPDRKKIVRRVAFGPDGTVSSFESFD